MGNIVYKIEGSYHCSFFELFVPSRHIDFEKGTVKRLSVFVHEYVHYLQDLTTNFGINGLFAYGEYVSSVVNRIYESEKNGVYDIKFPFTINDNKDNVLLNRELRRLAFGTVLSEDEQDLGKTIFLRKVIPSKRSVLTPNSHVAAVPTVIMQCTGNKDFEFGSAAIMESMAFLVERLGTKDSLSSPDYPYYAAEIIAETIAPDFAKDKLNILALCDMSLLSSSVPGKSFYTFLQMVKDGKVVVNKPEDVIDFHYSKMKADWPTIQFYFLIVRRKLLNYLKGIAPEYTKIVKNLMLMVLHYRLDKPYFFLDLARSCKPDGENPVLKELIRDFGSPAIRDENYNYYAMGGNTPFAMQMRAVLEIVRLFEDGNNGCGMCDWCDSTMNFMPQNGIVVDERCFDAPWTRVNDARLCPYALLWKHWNLSKVNPI